MGYVEGESFSGGSFRIDAITLAGQDKLDELRGGDR